jgi:SagB-type dehydrogenase family enzyme
MPLRDAIQARRSERSFAQRTLDLQTLSDLLWAAFGPISPKRRSAPSSHNRQETDLYVLLEQGSYRYDALENKLVCVTEEDLRAASGSQDYVGTAPLELAYVADKTKITGKTDRGVVETIYVDTGFISQNVYLFCASEGLATVVRAMVPKDALAARLHLAPEQEITLVQSIGWKPQEK